MKNHFKERTDLALVPIRDLILEIDNRVDNLVLSMMRCETGKDKNNPMVSCFCSQKDWPAEVGLAEILKEHIIVNFHNDNKKNE